MTIAYTLIYILLLIIAMILIMNLTTEIVKETNKKHPNRIHIKRKTNWIAGMQLILTISMIILLAFIKNT